MTRRRALDSRDFLGGLIFGIPLSLFLGGLIAIVRMRQFHTNFDPLKMPAYFWFYRTNAYVVTELLKGTVIAGLVSAFAVFLFFRRRPTLHGDARWASEAEVASQGLRSDKGILLGKKGGRFLVFGGAEHVLLEAPTRAGKGVGVVIPNLLQWPDSVVVLDVKQENWEKTAAFRKSIGQQVLLFDPLDTQGRTVRYNPLGYINRHDEVEVINELQKIAAMFFPPPVSGDSFWADSARTAFIGVGAYVAATASGSEPGRPFTIGEIYRNLTVGNPKTRFPRIIERRAREGRPLSEPCVAALNDFTTSSDNTFTSIRQSVTARIGLWLNPYVDAATSESEFDFRDFRNTPISLYLGVSPDNLERVSDLYNLLFQQLVDLNVRERPTQDRHSVQLLLVLDEFARLGRASVLASGFSYVAGYGIRMLPVIQSRSQLRAVYGKDICDEIVANCGVEIAFTPKESIVAKELSDRLGSYTFKAKSRSSKEFDGWSRTISVSDQKRALMLPQELLELPRNEMIILRGGIPPIKGRKLAYYLDKVFSDRSSLLPPPVPARPLSANEATAFSRSIREEEAAFSEAADSDGKVPPSEDSPGDHDPSVASENLVAELSDEPDPESVAALIDQIVIDRTGR